MPAKAGRRLVAGLRAAESDILLAPAVRLLDDPPFWHAAADWVAWFLAPGFDRRYRLGMNWRGRVTVGDHFLVKPVLPWVDGGASYVLALSRNAARLVRGIPHGAGEVDLPGGLLNLDRVLAAHDTDEMLHFHSAGGGPGRWDAVFHGPGVGTDDAKDDLLRYFRAVARAIHPVLRDGRTPWSSRESSTCGRSSVTPATTPTRPTTG
ncbi:MAG: hypothetical protein JWO38_7872 [Gemmataceae bacterium]|nr:hypothetical protein [Gemmataceae bacterium]